MSTKTECCVIELCHGNDFFCDVVNGDSFLSVLRFIGFINLGNNKFITIFGTRCQRVSKLSARKTSGE